MTLDRDDIEAIAEAVINRFMNLNSAPGKTLIHTLAGDDIEAMMDAREREIRAKRKGKRT